jgi:hypothetical protein
MIFSYNEFLVEKLIQMINESEVVYSQKFKKLLKDIDSPLSKHLIDIENKDLKVTSNYFDISDSKDTFSFIADRRAQEIIGAGPKFAIYKNGSILTHNLEQNGKIFDLLGYQPKGDKGYHPREGEKGEILAKAVSPATGNTFLRLKFPDGECVLNEIRVEYDNNEVWSKNRQSIRIGRGVRAILSASGEKFTDAQIEDFVNKYKSAFDRMNDIYKNFELVSGDDIAHWYNSNNYLHETRRGTLGNSCMATVPSSYFQIYTKNPNVCSLLILKSEDDPSKIVGRALVWKLSKPNDVIFMDRVYYTDDSQMQLFRDYAKFKKWHHKKRNDSSDEGTLVTPEGEDKFFETLLVEIRATHYSKYPYVDTLKYLDDNRARFYTLSNVSDDTKTLESTSGGYEGSECDNCGGEGRVDCPNCDGNGEVDCPECDGDRRVDCDECDDGEVDCTSCDGTGEDSEGNECSDCDGKGKVDCDECDGRGKKDCSRCDGDGVVECDECDGNGRVDCPECNW